MPDPGAPEELFRETASYYARFRPPYPDEAIDVLAGRFDLGEDSYVIDLGCGTGQLSVPLARRGTRVYAIDPSAEMLVAGREAAELRGVPGIEWLQGDDRTFAELLPRREFALCTMGASFHWMDRERVLSTLAGRLAAGGGVALLSHRLSAWTDDSDWASACRDVIIEFLGPSRRAGGGTYEDPPESHETVLRRSAFCRVETHRLETPWPLTVDSIVGLQLSTSYGSPALLGARVEAFRETLTERLYALAPSGAFDWQLRTEVIVATR